MNLPHPVLFTPRLMTLNRRRRFPFFSSWGSGSSSRGLISRRCSCQLELFVCFIATLATAATGVFGVDGGSASGQEDGLGFREGFSEWTPMAGWDCHFGLVWLGRTGGDVGVVAELQTVGSARVYLVAVRNLSGHDELKSEKSQVSREICEGMGAFVAMAVAKLGL